MMLFAQHFSVIGFCILHFFPGSILLVKIWSIGTVWGWFLVFGGDFLVCMYMYVCGYVCTQWTADWITVISIISLPLIEIKQIFTFVTFFFLSNTAHNWWKVSISDFRAEEVPSVKKKKFGVHLLSQLQYFYTLLWVENVLKYFATRLLTEHKLAPLVWLP